MTNCPLLDLLRLLVEQGGTALHLKVGQPPIMRLQDQLTRTNLPPLTPEELRTFLDSILGEEQRQRYEEARELDLSCEIPNLARFRLNVFQQRQNISAVFQPLPVAVPSLEELGWPKILKQVALLPRGLVLVTGPPRSGKSTTLAALIDYLNHHTRKHIITLEAPIAFVHQEVRCTIQQRELGRDTFSFPTALRYAVRQNPEVIMLDEMRGEETIAAALAVAETGCLVLAALPTVNVVQTVEYLLSAFPPERLPQIRMQLSTTLQAIISQTLLPKAREPGRIAAFEIMLVTPAIRNLIREGKTYQLPSLLQAGGEQGMVSFDQYLWRLYQRGEVTYEDALTKTSNPRDFARRAQGRGETGRRESWPSPFTIC
ncbi:MAG TPA: PilT/PilU family type 4a pilus ATPase [Armatimonadetes bacterium]|nr:PilT/PilU family type 4a pilus ATPase [Armatimonadota bacterium]